MNKYTLKNLNALAEKVKFNRDTLEKVLRLAELLKFFNDHKDLRHKYVLKGGTAINLCLFDFPRLSVDIDLNFNLDCSKDEMISIRELHKKIISAYVQSIGYTIHSKSRFSYSLDAYLLQYVNAVGSNDYIKLELNYSNRVQILKPVNYEINSNIVRSVHVLGLDKIELYGSKIAALIGRTTARDIFDVSEMISSQMIANNEIDMLRKCSIFYLLVSNEFQSLDILINQFKTNLEHVTFHHIKRNLLPMLHIGSKIDLDHMKFTVASFIEAMFNSIKASEINYVKSFNTGEYKPMVLFKPEIAENLENHPMVMWKMQKFNK